MHDEIPGEEPIHMEVTDELDLHGFKPAEVASVVEEYLLEAQAKGFVEVRLIHGKGIGHLRRTVHATLSKLPNVAGFRLAHEQLGGWGATVVTLKPKP
jgi:dsDNA-specific endonuclease/ATPase MutS2